MNCDNCKRPVDKSIDATCPFCGLDFSPDSLQKKMNLQSLVKPAARIIPTLIQLVLDVDRSDSSRNFIIGIPKSTEFILTDLKRKAPNIETFFFSHSDEDYGEKLYLHTERGTIEQAIEDVKALNYGGGGDAEETHLKAIYDIVKQVPWENNLRVARGVMISLINADSKPFAGMTAKKIGEMIRNLNVLFYLICQPTPTLQELVDGANGMMFQISNDPDPKELTKIAEQIVKSIAVSVTKGSTVPLAG